MVHYLLLLQDCLLDRFVVSTCTVLCTHTARLRVRAPFFACKFSVSRVYSADLVLLADNGIREAVYFLM